MARPALTAEEVHSRRAEILDAAEHLFETQGLDAVSFPRIASRAACSPTTPYRYFASKEDVLLGLQTRGYQAVRHQLEAAASAEATATGKLRAIADAYIRFALERSRMYALLFRVEEGGSGIAEMGIPNSDIPNPDLPNSDIADSGGAASASAALIQAKREALDVCRQAFAQAEEGGDLRLRTDPLTAAHLFWAAAHGAVSLHLGKQLVVGRSLDDIVPTLIATLTAGLSYSEARTEDSP